MSFQAKNFVLAAVAAATLVACGGGGGGDSKAPEAQKISVTGQAAKGALSGALVVAESWDGTKWVAIEGATATTDATGNFELSYPEQKSPVRLKVQHKADAKMFNEASGKFEDMPTDLVLSSFVVDPSKNNINTYTELAFITAAGNYSQAAINAANAVARAVAGAPAHAIGSTASETTLGNQHDQTMKSLLQAVGSDCDATCAVKKLTENADKTLTTVNGTVSFDASALDRFYSNLNSLGVVSASQESALKEELSNITETPSSEGGEQFDKFVQNLRTSFLQLQSNWNSSGKTLQQRYADFTTDGTMSISHSVSDMLTSCYFWEGSSNAECLEEEGWSSTDGKTYTKRYTTSNGVSMLVTASGTQSRDSFSIRYVAEQQRNGATFEKADLTLSGSGINMAAEDIQQVLGKAVKMTLNGSIDKSGTDNKYSTQVTIKDMGVEVSGMTLSQTASGNVHLNANNSTLKLQGEVGISSNLGDSGKGTLSATVLNKAVGNADDTVPVVEKLDATFDIAAKDADLQSIKLNLSGNFTPAEASSGGFSSMNLNAYAKVNNGDVVKFDLSRTAAEKATASLTVGVGSNAIVAKVDAVQTKPNAGSTMPGYCFEVEQAFFCANDLNLASSDGKIKAVVNAETLQGDLTYNGTKFGEISKSGVTVDGKKYSFY